ncbi:MAG: glycosyltransferase family 4 protein [Clostridiales bacterium]|nr:glycosyltransferase family 4 protein [Clostridiales bacterium]
MKILHILTDTNIGGAGICVLSLIDWAQSANAGIKIHVVLPEGSDLMPEMGRRRIKVFEAPFLSEESFDRRAVVPLIKIVRREKPDIVHTHAALSGRLAGRICGAKVVATRHSVFDIGRKQTRFPFNVASKAANSLLADAFIAVSPAAAENLKLLGAPQQKIRVIFNGVAPSPFLAQEDRDYLRRSYGFNREDFIVSIMARLVDVKGHDTILDAARMIKNLDSSIRFLIAGEGPARRHLEERVEGEGLSNVTFTGFVKEIYLIENITDLQINASYGTEATSMALLSGMSLGIPAIASDYGGNPYVIEDGANGIIFQMKNGPALTKAILDIKSNPDLYSMMSAKAMEIYSKRFTLDAMGSSTLELYREVLQKPERAKKYS